MLMVVFLHNLGQGGVLDWGLSSHHAMAYMLLENFCIVAVNVFGLISGYLAVGKPVRINKLGTMWFQVAFWSVAIGLVGLALFGRTYLRTFVGTLTPVLSREYWYFNAYIGMQLLAYFVAPVLVKMPRAAVASCSLMLAALFCSLGFIEGETAHGLAATNGYSAVWLLVLWLCGGIAAPVSGQAARAVPHLAHGACLHLDTVRVPCPRTARLRHGRKRCPMD